MTYYNFLQKERKKENMYNKYFKGKDESNDTIQLPVYTITLTILLRQLYTNLDNINPSNLNYQINMN